MTVMGDQQTKQHVHRKMANRHVTHTHTRTPWPCVNKERYVFVLHLGCELQNSGPVHSCSLGAVSGASPGWVHPRGLHWEACTQSDIWTAQEAIIPTLRLFFSSLFKWLSLFPYHSIYFCLCKSQSIFFSSPLLPSWRGPLVPVTGERMMNSSAAEPADSLAAGPSPLVLLIPFPASSLFSFFSHSLSSPVLSFQSGGAIDWGSRGTCVSAREGRSDWWHITAIFGSLISPACRSLLV